MKYRGRLGNKAAQYVVGRAIAAELGFELFARPLSLFPNARGVGPPPPGLLDCPRAEVLGGHRIDLASLLADRRPRVIVLNGLFLRYEYFQPHKNVIRRWWLDSGAPAPGHPHDLTIHVRAGDVWQSGTRPGQAVHPEYCALPFSFYSEIIQSFGWRRILVVTDDPADPMVTKLARSHDAAVQSGTVADDFNTLRSSRNLVLSVSTFAWWAGWLSHAERIYFPVAGLFDSERARHRPPLLQQDLWVCDEDRYRAIRPRLPSGPWRGTEEDRRTLLEG